MKLDPENLPKTFCILPWIHSAIDPDSRVKPCCISTPFNLAMGYINDTTRLADIWNGDKYKKMRREMLSGEWPAACSQCKVNEEARGYSYRTDSNQRFLNEVKAVEVLEDGSAKFKQVFIDYRFTNKCNFKCITCGEPYSSSWAVETKKERSAGHWRLDENNKPYMLIADGKKHYSPIIEVDSAPLLADLREFYKDLSAVYFAGGEPLISDAHYEILNLLIETQQPVTISYNTNFSELNYKGIDVLELWSKVNGPIVLFPSIDGVGPKGECIRNGFVTETFKQNIKTILDFNKTQGTIPNRSTYKIQLNYNITFGITNVLDVVDTVRWLEEQHQGYDQQPIIAFNPIFGPKYHSVRALDRAQRETVIELLKEQIDNYLQETGNRDRTKSMIEQFLKWIQNVDYDPITNDEANYALRVLDDVVKHKTLNWREHLVFLRDFLETKAAQNDK